MLEFFKRFLGVQGNKFAMSDLAQDLTEGLDVEVAIAAHQNWKLRLEAYLEGRSEEDLRPENICFDDRCDLGRWIHSTGKARLGTYPGFTALVEHHRMFHYAASNVVSLVQGGKQVDAERMLTTTYARHSELVVRALNLMQQMSRSRPAAKRA